MKKLILATAVALVSTGIQAADFRATAGMSGAGYTTADYADGVALNPSLGAAYNPEDDDFSFLINGGALIFDKDDMVTKVDDLVDLIDEIDSSPVLSIAQAQELKTQLQGIDEKSASINAGAGLSVAIPNKYLSAAFIYDAQLDIAVMPDIAQNDFDIIDDAIGGIFDPSAELQSSIQGLGAVKTELGVAFSKSFQLGENYLLLGVTPKKVEVETIIYDQTVADYDEDDFDSDEYTYKDSGMNFDLGATYIAGKLRYGLVAKNIKEETFKTIDPDIDLEISRQIISSVGYVGEKFTAELALDLSAAPLHHFAGDSRLLRVGLEYRPWGWLKLRGGLQQDMEDTIPNTYSFGLGLGRSFSLSYITGDDSAEGFALGAGFRF